MYGIEFSPEGDCWLCWVFTCSKQASNPWFQCSYHVNLVTSFINYDWNYLFTSAILLRLQFSKKVSPFWWCFLHGWSRIAFPLSIWARGPYVTSSSQGCLLPPRGAWCFSESTPQTWIMRDCLSSFSIVDTIIKFSFRIFTLRWGSSGTVYSFNLPCSQFDSTFCKRFLLQAFFFGARCFHILILNIFQCVEKVHCYLFCLVFVVIIILIGLVIMLINILVLLQVYSLELP